MLPFRIKTGAKAVKSLPAGPASAKLKSEDLGNSTRAKLLRWPPSPSTRRRQTPSFSLHRGSPQDIRGARTHTHPHPPAPPPTPYTPTQPPPSRRPDRGSCPTVQPRWTTAFACWESRPRRSRLGATTPHSWFTSL